MFKLKVSLPDNPKLQSPYQLEECQNRLRDLRRRDIRFMTLDDDRIQFHIRCVKSDGVPFPMVAYELEGTLRRWGGTGTQIEAYQLRRLSARTDTWVALFVLVSLVSSVLLMLPSLSIGIDPLLLFAFILIAFVLGMLPLITWVQQTRALNIEQEIDTLHQSILSTLQIEDVTSNS